MEVFWRGFNLQVFATNALLVRVALLVVLLDQHFESSAHLILVKGLELNANWNPVRVAAKNQRPLQKTTTQSPPQAARRLHSHCKNRGLLLNKARRLTGNAEVVGGSPLRWKSPQAANTSNISNANSTNFTTNANSTAHIINAVGGNNMGRVGRVTKTRSKLKNNPQDSINPRV